MKIYRIPQTEKVEASKKLVTSRDQVYKQKVLCFAIMQFSTALHSERYGDPLQSKLLIAAK
jgi:hypothetical protein